MEKIFYYNNRFSSNFITFSCIILNDPPVSLLGTCCKLSAIYIYIPICLSHTHTHIIVKFLHRSVSTCIEECLCHICFFFFLLPIDLDKSDRPLRNAAFIRIRTIQAKILKDTVGIIGILYFTSDIKRFPRTCNNIKTVIEHRNPFLLPLEILLMYIIVICLTIKKCTILYIFMPHKTNII